MIYENHFKNKSLKIVVLYKTRTQQAVVDEDTFVVVSQPVFFFFFFPS